MDSLKRAVRLGMECRKKAREYSARFKNPMVAGTPEYEAWDAGYHNDLHAWMEVRSRFFPPKKGRPAQGRFRAHDPVVHNAHTSRPDRGEFLGYDKCPTGWCRVLLNRSGYKTVPVDSITRPEKKEVAV